ncbi:hypothetical protein ACQEVF_56880 [Nonomuraea polychroma]|uniref:hypothetical protein n=1 Tax=Nonomuraea polychroma TaxID=46176 RepID=UPI003D8E9F42
MDLDVERGGDDKTVANLAAGLAFHGQRVLIMDQDVPSSYRYGLGGHVDYDMLIIDPPSSDPLPGVFQTVIGNPKGDLL